jgi:hypothetical protein
VSGRYPSFEFLHGHGLGVLAVGGEVPQGLSLLFAADEADTDLTRKFFRQLGTCIEIQRTHNQQRRDIEILRGYERAVNSSRVLRAYRVLTEEGVGSFVKKAGKSGHNEQPKE